VADDRKLIVGTLASVLGSIGGAVLLFTSVPAEESGRKVAVTVAPSGHATIRHVSGPQYLRAYLDAVNVPTACDGITRGVRMGQTYTEAQCTTMLQGALVEHGSRVIACVPGLYGHGYQGAAATSLAYNIGWPSFCASTAARLFNAGQWLAACDAFTMWVKATDPRKRRKIVLAGLVARRARERAMCRTGLVA
jgi:lysozyme